MRQVLRWAWFVILLVVTGVGITALVNWMEGKHRPLWEGPAFMGILVLGTFLVQACRKRGWITSGLWSRPRALEQRERDLATERERIIEDARRGLKLKQ